MHVKVNSDKAAAAKVLQRSREQAVCFCQCGLVFGWKKKREKEQRGRGREREHETRGKILIRLSKAGRGGRSVPW